MFNQEYIEAQYQRWIADPQSVSSEWDTYFKQQTEVEVRGGGDKSPSGVSPPISMQSGLESDDIRIAAPDNGSNLQSKVNQLIFSYRYYGYLYAKVNPLGNYITPDLKHIFYTMEGLGNYLNIADFGISENDLEQKVETDSTLKIGTARVKEVISHLKALYCHGTGLETLHIQNRTMRHWVINKYEQYHDKEQGEWSKEQRQRLQKDLIKAEQFEKFVHANFIGQKRFSLEGGEVLIPALRYLLDSACDYGVQQIVLGMAHRGRLNVFANALRKRAAEIFIDFTNTYSPHTYGGSGDVKYHLGHNFDITFDKNRKIHISLVANPSHLEAVDAVVVGKCRGIQRRENDRHRKKVIPILIHGDAAFSGQGVVTEVFNLSQLRGYKTGGTVHIILNNQIGFTTSSIDARSTFFASDIAKILPIPIFHVNGDDPEAVARAIRIALLYRQKFSFDVVVDIVCYRRLGHNEADEPSFTHPIMYRIIQKHDSVRALYGRKLDAEGTFPMEAQTTFSEKYMEVLKGELVLAKEGGMRGKNDAFQAGDWKKYQAKYSFEPVDTAVKRKQIVTIGKRLLNVPDGFKLNPKLTRILGERDKTLESGKGIDWSFAEHLAFATLLEEGYAIRLSGEDCRRGTFSHRHAVWWDIESSVPRSHTPLQNISATQEEFSAYDSPLSEYSVLGYDYGYSLAQPNILVIWEAQFGDFVNGAQVIIDQFIAAAQTKWHRSSGLVMLLPHGYEGQGPEHSSAHLERFLQLCAEDNMQVVNVSTPAQYFHVLRRQMKQTFRKPLIIMTPKSLLRHKRCVSTLNDLSAECFQTVLDDHNAIPENVKRIIFSSGHHYYDLLSEREQRKRDDVALVRLEQFYPFPQVEISKILNRYPREAVVVWSQEEPRNRGAFRFLREELIDILKELKYAAFTVSCRPESASPATGSFVQHNEEIQKVLEDAFAHDTTA